MPSFSAIGGDGRLLGGAFLAVLDEHPDGALTHLGECRDLPWHCSIFSTACGHVPRPKFFTAASTPGAVRAARLTPL